MNCPFNKEVERMRKEITSLKKQVENWKGLDEKQRDVTRQTQNIFTRYEQILEGLGVRNRGGSFDECIRRFFKEIADQKYKNKDHYVFKLIALEYDGKDDPYDRPD